MMYVRPLSEAECRGLWGRARTEVGRVSERSHMVLLSDRHYSVPQIATIFACSEATVRGWLSRFAAEGRDGVADRPRAGRPRKADAAVRETIRHAIDTAPAAVGYAFCVRT